MAAKNKISRRQFLKILAFSGAAAGGLVLKEKLGFNNYLNAAHPEVFQITKLLMGVVVNLTIVGGEPGQAQFTAQTALSKMSKLVDICNRFDPNSQLCRLNLHGSLPEPDPQLVAILRQADLVSQASHGAFDVSVQPLLDVYGTTHNGQSPSSSAIQAALAKIGYTGISLDPSRISLMRSGMSLTLDGIAKGAVIDSAVDVMRANGFENVIVEAGGDLLAAGRHASQQPWKIGLRSPRSDSTFKMPVLHVENMAVATSGDYLQPFTQDYSIHHILDPRQGISSPELASVTVVAPFAMLADALATAVMVSGVQDGLQLLQRFPGCEAYLVDKYLQVSYSAGMTNYLV